MRASRTMRIAPAVPIVAALTTLAISCDSGGDDDATAHSTAAVSTSAATTGTSSSSSTRPTGSTHSTPATSAPATSRATTPAPVEDFVARPADFVNLADMAAVRGFFIANPLGHLDEALAVARSPDGGEYPVGTIIQLVPQEAMVKRVPGFRPEFGDWEFFELDVSEKGTTIHQRGGAEIVNRFGLSCGSCHALAEPQWDFVCEDDHGCDPLPIGDDVIASLQDADPRPRR